MVSDREESLYRELAEVQDFKKELKSLKAKVNKLVKQIEQLELSGLLDQIYNLDKRITECSDELLETNRAIAKLMIISIYEEVCRQVPKKYSDYVVKLTIDIGIMLGNINTSEDPYQVAHDFNKDCDTTLKSFGVKGLSIYA
jgi:Mg2+ and Co2+ transporter CorA